jgi:hypothetical protein
VSHAEYLFSFNHHELTRRVITREEAYVVMNRYLAGKTDKGIFTLHVLHPRESGYGFFELIEKRRCPIK